jgi:hypothetical protein
MTHTPGPWWACPPDTDSGNWEVEDGYGHTATVYGDDVPAAANASLIAAAPELLATLKRRAERRDAFDDDEWQDVLRLIAKAEGRE